MASQIKTIGINGIEGYVINVQVKVLGGPFTMNIVGLGDAAIKEARDRIVPGPHEEVRQLPQWDLVRTSL